MASEYTVRQDIILALEARDLTAPQAEALLASLSPLADLYKDWCKQETGYMDNIRDTVEGRADELIRKETEMLKAPVYKFPADYAREHGELEQYRTSLKANIACAKAVYDAISSHHEQYSFDSRAAVKDVVGKFGYDRTLFVLAATIQNMEWDGRFSNTNKSWSRTIPIFDSRSSDYAVRSHPALTDMFVTTARHEHLLSLPLTRGDIKAEALNILSQFQNAREPNSPSGTHFIAQVSPDFLARAKDRDRDRMMNMLPFESLALCSLDGKKGIYATIKADENRFQKLQLRKPSIRNQLAAAKATQTEKPAAQQHQKDKGAR